MTYRPRRRWAPAGVIAAPVLVLATLASCVGGRSAVPAAVSASTDTSAIAAEAADAADRKPIVVPSTIIGRVVSDQTGAPVDGAEVGLAERTARSITDAAGRFTLAAPSSGEFTLSVRRLGFTARTLAVKIDSTAPPDTLIVSMEDWTLLQQRELERLREPTSVTPSRPNDARAKAGEEALRDFLDSERRPYPSPAPAMGVGQFMGQRTRHVVDRALCHAAIAVIDSVDGRRGAQVHLFRVGRTGYAAWDPSIRDGEWEVLFWFDRRMRLITAHQW